MLISSYVKFCVTSGGTGEKFWIEFSKYNKLSSEYKLTGINNEFIKQDTMESTLKDLKLDCDRIISVLTHSPIYN